MVTKESIELLISKEISTMFHAISLPIGTHSNKLPFGIQLMAKRFQETKYKVLLSVCINGDLSLSSVFIGLPILTALDQLPSSFLME